MHSRRWLVTLVVCLSVAPLRAQWTPPVGIPAPSFGIVQVTPTSGKTVSAWPGTLPAGSVLILSGTSANGGTINCAGTAANPCFLVGAQPGGNVNTGDFHILGSYTIVDGLTFTGLHSVEVGGDHNVLRNSVSLGTPNDPTGAAVYMTGTFPLVWKNRVTDHANIGTATAPKFSPVDTDAHGISAVRAAQSVWILENETARNAGDGINVNSYPYDSAGFTAINKVYIGRNNSHDNKQTAVWTKQSQDVIVSQNELHHSVADPAGFSYGQCVGYQYGTQRAWYIYNNIHDCDVGIGISGDFGGEPGPRSVIIAHNAFSNISGLVPPGNGGGVWGAASIFISGGASYFVIDNLVPSTLDAIHATRDAGLFAANTTGNTTVVTDGPVIPPSATLTPAAVYGSFLSTYGLDITGGAVPVAGSVGPTFAVSGVAAAGAAGAQGPIGPQGPAGPMGPQGPQGIAGPAGPVGSTGATGSQGANGDAGAPGASGSNGINGVDGAIGPIGQTGAQGASGPQGVPGQPGADGAVGPRGPAGSDATVDLSGILARLAALEARPVWIGFTCTFNPAGALTCAMVRQ